MQDPETRPGAAATLVDVWIVRLCWPDERIVIAETRWRWWAVIRAVWLEWWTPSSYWPIVTVERVDARKP